MWFKKLSTNIMFSFFISIVVNIGMWFERFVIIVTSLAQGLPSFFMDHVLSNFCGYWDLYWNHWILLCVVPALCQNLPCNCTGRGENNSKIFWRQI